MAKEEGSEVQSQKEREWRMVQSGDPFRVSQKLRIAWITVKELKHGIETNMPDMLFSYCLPNKV